MKHCAWLLNTGAIFSAKEKKKPNNTNFHRVCNLANTQNQVYVKATRDIAAGTEILFPYSRSYGNADHQAAEASSSAKSTKRKAKEQEVGTSFSMLYSRFTATTDEFCHLQEHAPRARARGRPIKKTNRHDDGKRKKRDAKWSMYDK
jgi:hypothetical protein